MGKKITIKKSKPEEEKKATKAKAKKSKAAEAEVEEESAVPAEIVPVDSEAPSADVGTEEGEAKPKRKRVVEEEDPNAPRDEQGRIIREVITVGDDEDEDKDEITEDEDHTEEELEKMKKWWLEEPFRSLLDPELVRKTDFIKYDLSDLINDFTQKMLKEELVDFRISGLAINSSAKMYHWKITDVIKEEEKIEEAKVKERMKREVPKAIAQPLREGRKLASSEELFSAMRRAIIETMQKREKLRITRIKKEEKKEVKVQTKAKGRLPAEILKHITGSEETIEQRLNRWHQKIKELIRLENRTDEIISFEDLKKVIWASDMEEYGKRLQYIQAFEALMFLASLNKVHLEQLRQRDPIQIQLIDKTIVDLH
jgi:hypothetical protein